MMSQNKQPLRPESPEAAEERKKRELAMMRERANTWVRKAQLGWLGPLLTVFAFWYFNGGTKRPWVSWKIHGAYLALMLAFLLSLVYLAVNLYAAKRARDFQKRLERERRPLPEAYKVVRLLHSELVPFIFIVLIFSVGMLIMRPRYLPEIPEDSQIPQLSQLDKGEPITQYASWRGLFTRQEEELSQVIAAATRNADGSYDVEAGMALQSYSFKRTADAEALFSLLKAGPMLQDAGHGKMEITRMPEPLRLEDYPDMEIYLGELRDAASDTRKYCVMKSGGSVLSSLYMGEAHEDEWLRELARYLLSLEA